MMNQTLRTEGVPAMDRVLIVANKTLGSDEVAEYVRTRMAKGPCQFTLLVPATPRSDYQRGFRFAKVSLRLAPQTVTKCPFPVTTPTRVGGGGGATSSSP